MLSLWSPWFAYFSFWLILNVYKWDHTSVSDDRLGDKWQLIFVARDAFNVLFLLCSPSRLCDRWQHSATQVRTQMELLAWCNALVCDIKVFSVLQGVKVTLSGQTHCVDVRCLEQRRTLSLSASAFDHSSLLLPFHLDQWDRSSHLLCFRLICSLAGSRLQPGGFLSVQDWIQALGST